MLLRNEAGFRSVAGDDDASGGSEECSEPAGNFVFCFASRFRIHALGLEGQIT